MFPYADNKLPRHGEAHHIWNRDTFYWTYCLSTDTFSSLTSCYHDSHPVPLNGVPDPKPLDADRYPPFRTGYFCLLRRVKGALVTMPLNIGTYKVAYARFMTDCNKASLAARNQADALWVKVIERADNAVAIIVIVPLFNRTLTSA